MNPDLYIFAVFPSNSGIAISGAVVGYVTGSYKKSNKKNFRKEQLLS